MSRREPDRAGLENLLFFIHVPKTGGTSFRVAAQRLFAGRVLNDYGPESPDTSQEIVEHVYERRDLTALAQNIAERGIRMICGHVGYHAYRDLVAPERVIVFLREPVQRVVSEFHHWKRERRFEGTLLQFARQEMQRNTQWRMVRGLNLARAGLVGLSEHYSHSLDALTERVGLQLPYLELNSNPKRRGAVPYRLSEAEAAEVRELNAEDLLLYRRAAAEFSARTGIAVEPPAAPSAEMPRSPDIDGEAQLLGAVDGLRDGRLSGWAMLQGLGRAVHLDVFLDDELVHTIVADRYRQDLDELGVHPTGHTGFVVDLGEVEAGTTIHCRLHGSERGLRGSPLDV